MSGSPTHALPPFLHFLGSFPDPATVSRALVTGPLAAIGASSCIVMAAHHDVELRLVSSHGLPDAANDRYRTISLRLDVPIVNAYRQRRTIVSDVEGFSETFAAVTIDSQLWAQISESTGGSSLLDAPIMIAGSPVGTIGMICAERDTWPPGALALVEGICGALALWLTHPRSRVGARMTSWVIGGYEGLTLTVRQEVILRLVEKGASNEEIAAALGFSESTVKQDILRAAQSLRATGRHETVRLARVVGLLV